MSDDLEGWASWLRVQIKWLEETQSKIEVILNDFKETLRATEKAILRQKKKEEV